MDNNIKARVLEVLESLEWLLDSHDSSVELVEIKENKVILHPEGECADCDTNCIEQAFREKIPAIEVIFDSQMYE